MNRIFIPIALTLVTSSLCSIPAFAADEVPVRQSGGISYVSGGVSEEGRDRILAMGRDFNLKLVFAARSGAYMSDVAVVVSDTRRRQLLAAKADGPMFFARLPAGQLRIEATANGTTLRESVAVSAQGQRSVDFRWND